MNLFFLIIIINLIFACLCYIIASKKNYNKSHAFIFGYLFSFIALIYYLTCTRKSYDDKIYYKCLECNEIFLKNGLYCPNCKKNTKLKKIRKFKLQ